MADRLTPEAFVRRAIERLRSPGQRGIHTVYSGFNEAFREYFSGEDPVAWTKKLAAEGKVVVRLAKGGAVLYFPEDAPSGLTRARGALEKMGLTENAIAGETEKPGEVERIATELAS